jgi:hypothetical protein
MVSQIISPHFLNTWKILYPSARRYYTYRPLLFEKSFRYIELLHGQGKSVAKYRLHFATFENLPPYEAISYTWGDPNMRKISVCDGSILRITQNASRHYATPSCHGICGLMPLRLIKKILQKGTIKCNQTWELGKPDVPRG